MKSISKNEIKTLLRLADKDIYKNLLLFRKGDKIHTYYLKKCDYSVEFIIREFAKDGYELLIVYNLQNFENWSKEDENKYLHDYGYKLTDKALAFATEKHKGQYRKSPNHEEYITHPINVAKLVEKYKSDSCGIDYLIAAAYLHDVIEDTDTTYYDLVNNFGIEIAYLVNEVTTDKNMKNELGKSKYLAMKMNSITNWALVIKLCDRLDNISDLSKMDSSFRNKYFNETLYIVTYLLNNRLLTKTQLIILTDILFELNKSKSFCDNPKNYNINALTLKVKNNLEKK